MLSFELVSLLYLPDLQTYTIICIRFQEVLLPECSYGQDMNWPHLYNQPRHIFILSTISTYFSCTTSYITYYYNTIAIYICKFCFSSLYLLTITLPTIPANNQRKKIFHFLCICRVLRYSYPAKICVMSRPSHVSERSLQRSEFERAAHAFSRFLAT